MVFHYQRFIHVYETDLMGVVHHSNYLRFCEEARVAWFRSRNLITRETDSVFGFTVYETQVRHLAPSRYGDELNISLQVKIVKAKLIFQYKLCVKEKTVALVKSVHCRLDQNFKVQRFDLNVIKIMEKELWTETWL